MLRDRMERARRLGVAEFADLEEIVAEVLASLDGEDPAGDEEPLALRRAIDKRAGPQRRSSRTEQFMIAISGCSIRRMPTPHA